MNERNKRSLLGLTIAMTLALAIIATTVLIVLASPSLVTYTISNHTITPPQTTEIDVEFSEKVDYKIAIETDTATIYDWTGSATHPKAKVWAGTFEANGSVVPVGDYTVNVTGTSTTTGESVVNDTEIITVTRPPVVTNPKATPDTIAADGFETSRLNVTVTDTAVDTVTVNLSQIGWSPAQGMEHLGNGVYSTTTNASVGTPPGTYNLPVNATNIYGISNTSVSIQLRTVTGIKPSVSISTDKTIYNPGDPMIITLNLKNPMLTDQDVQFVWWLGKPDSGDWTYIVNMPLTLLADCDYSIPIPIRVGDWGATGFDAVWRVELHDPATFDIISSDTAEWSYAPLTAGVSAREGEIAAANIAEEIGEVINKTLKIEIEEVVAGLPA